MSDTRIALNEASVALKSASVSPRLDAELLMAAAMGISREFLLLGEHHSPSLYDAAAPLTFANLITRRLAHEPIAYIIGERDFWTITLKVAPGVLIPRPDSETLIDAAVAHFGKIGPKRVLDLGTGSGALLLAALDQWPAATGVGIDASDTALAIARGNAGAIAPGRSEILKGGWDGTGEAFDLILCNPPYIATDESLPPDVIDWEPASALFAGSDGLDDYRALAVALPPQLASGGLACIEIGHTQRAAVMFLFENAGFTVDCRKDLAGRDRCLLLTAN